MARLRSCRVCGDWHALDKPWPHNCREPRNLARSALPTPMLIRDCMDATWNPADGRTYDSKAEYHRAVRAAGCEIVGNDSAASRPHVDMDETPDFTADVAEAVNAVM